MDLDRIARIVQQAATLTNVGSAGVQALVVAISQIAAILRQRGYEIDTSKFDELIADAERRRLIAEAEARSLL